MKLDVIMEAQRDGWSVNRCGFDYPVDRATHKRFRLPIPCQMDKEFLLCKNTKPCGVYLYRWCTLRNQAYTTVQEEYVDYTDSYISLVELLHVS